MFYTAIAPKDKKKVENIKIPFCTWYIFLIVQNANFVVHSNFLFFLSYQLVALIRFKEPRIDSGLNSFLYSIVLIIFFVFTNSRYIRTCMTVMAKLSVNMRQQRTRTILYSSCCAVNGLHEIMVMYIWSVYLKIFIVR